MPRSWIQTPQDSSLSDKEGWTKFGQNKYAAFRHHILVVERKENIAKNGPVIKQMDWPVNAKYKLENKKGKRANFTISIQESITSTISNKLSQEVLTKIGSSLEAGIANLKANIISELQSKFGVELITTLQNDLSATKTYSTEIYVEQLEAIEFTVPDQSNSTPTRSVFAYLKLRPIVKEFYLYRTEYIQLEYKKSWIWPDVRKTLTQYDLDLRKPLFKIVYYEPEDTISFSFDSYKPVIEEGDSVTSEELNSAFPSPARIQLNKTMEQLAKLAFPVSKKEKQSAAKEKTPTISGRKRVKAVLPKSDIKKSKSRK
ncbi:MAG: hypothetical protein NTX65_02550 [Ignavibacteriales bacterium]|nr:hypothetical protein [Ignavibacteriales bacterium]